MRYTTIFAHLSEIEKGLVLGDIVCTGDVLGVMGSTGQSTGPHLHLASAQGVHTAPWRLRGEKVITSPFQTNFAAQGVFGPGYPWVTTPWGCEDYHKKYKKKHKGLDLVPDRSCGEQDGSVRWTRSMTGVVSGSGEDPGYGLFIMVSHES